MTSPTSPSAKDTAERLAQLKLQLLQQRISAERSRLDDVPSSQRNLSRHGRHVGRDLRHQLNSHLQQLTAQQQLISSQVQSLNAQLQANTQAKMQYSHSRQGGYGRPSSSPMRDALPQTLLSTLQTQQTLLLHLSEQLTRDHNLTNSSLVKLRNFHTRRYEPAVAPLQGGRVKPHPPHAHHAPPTTWLPPYSYHGSSAYIGTGPLVTGYPQSILQQANQFSPTNPGYPPPLADNLIDTETDTANSPRQPSSRQSVVHEVRTPRLRLKRVLLAVAACQRLWMIQRHKKQHRLEQKINRALASMSSYFKQKSQRIYQSICSVTSDEATQLMQPKQSAFQLIFKRISADQQAALCELASAVESIVEEICNLTPTSPGLSHRVSHCLWLMIQEGAPFPPSYFWQAEKECLPLDRFSRLETTSNRMAAVLALGFILGRGLLTNVLFEPVQSGLLRQLKGEHVDNVKVLATVLFYICRRAMSNCASLTETSGSHKSLFQNSSTKQPLAVDERLKYHSALLPDPDISFFTKKHNRLYSTLQRQLTEWAVGFVQALNASHNEST